MIVFIISMMLLFLAVGFNMVVLFIIDGHRGDIYLRFGFAKDLAFWGSMLALLLGEFALSYWICNQINYFGCSWEYQALFDFAGTAIIALAIAGVASNFEKRDVPVRKTALALPEPKKDFGLTREEALELLHEAEMLSNDELIARYKESYSDFQNAMAKEKPYTRASQINSIYTAEMISRELITYPA